MLRCFGPSDNMAGDEEGVVGYIANRAARPIIRNDEFSDSGLSLSLTSQCLWAIRGDDSESQ
jgi:hypothetical protein